MIFVCFDRVNVNVDFYYQYNNEKFFRMRENLIENSQKMYLPQLKTL